MSHPCIVAPGATALGATVLGLALAGCAGGPPGPGGARVGHAAVTAPARPSAGVPSLTRAQALAPDARGARVRWWGGVDRIQADEGGRDCFTLRYGHSDANGELRWPTDPSEMHPFVACGPGRYARELVQPFTVLQVSGRVVDTTRVWGVSAPLVEIDAIERSSDCLQGTDPVAHPSCYVGPLQPQ